MLYVAFSPTKQLKKKFPKLISILVAFYNEIVSIDKNTIYHKNGFQ